MIRRLNLLDAPVRQAAEVKRVAAGGRGGAGARVNCVKADRTVHLCLC